MQQQSADSEPPASAPSYYPEAPASAPSYYHPTAAPISQVANWATVTNTIGYPRPQGKLSNFNWGLTSDAKAYYEKLYSDILTPKR